jgi:Amt family ammonium transporter
LSFFILQMLFCCTTATIVCGAVSERMRLPGYVLIVAIITGLIYPLFGHWVWNGLELGMPRGWLARRGFIDFGGSTVIHSVGGWSALAAVLVVGPRLKRFETKDTKLHGHNLPMAVLGVMLLWFGWIGFLGGCGLGFTEIVPMIVLNTMMAGAFGGMTALAVSWLLCQRSDVYLAMQGVISGLVAISAGCHIVTPSSSVAIGCIGAIVGMSASSLLERFKVDDVVAAFPAFGCAGIWGTLAVAFFGTDSAFQLPRSEQLLVQILGVLVCFVWSFGLSLIILRVTNHLFPFRVIPSHEHIGLNVAEHTRLAYGDRGASKSQAG